MSNSSTKEKAEELDRWREGAHIRYRDPNVYLSGHPENPQNSGLELLVNMYRPVARQNDKK